MPSKTLVADDWKAFQDLVGRIEALAAPRGAKVKSPDRVRDRVGGRKREVDASIRYRVGTADVLITVEARRHSDVQDVTWIEQLATKKTSIGAAITIAVSSSGFSDGAKELAKAHNIALRQVKEVSDTEIDRWLTPVSHIQPRFSVVAFDFSFFGCVPGRVDKEQLAPAVRALLDKDGQHAKIFLRPLRKEWLSLEDLFGWFYDTRGTRVFDDCDGNGTRITKFIRVEAEPRSILVETAKGLQDVCFIGMETKLWTHRRLVPPTLAVMYESAAGTTEAVHGQYDIDDGEDIIRVSLQDHLDKDVPAVSVQLGDRDGSGEFRPAKLTFLRGYRSDTKPGEETTEPGSSIRVVNPEEVS